MLPLLSKPQQGQVLNIAETERRSDLNLNLNLNCRDIEGRGTSGIEKQPTIYHARNWSEIESVLLSSIRLD